MRDDWNTFYLWVDATTGRSQCDVRPAATDSKGGEGSQHPARVEKTGRINDSQRIALDA
jgi:hypothetical protein